MRDVRSHDSESRVVAVRSLQPTLLGIGPDGPDEIEDDTSGIEQSCPTVERTIIELEASALIEEHGSGTLVDSYEVRAEPAIEPEPRSTPAIPLLRVVPQVAPPVASPAPPVSAPQAPHLAAAPAPRASLSDPMDVLFDAAYALCFLQTAVEGASHCMASAMTAVGARAALVHLLDGHSGDFVTVAGFGNGSDGQIRSRLEDDDWLLSAGIFKERPVTMEYGGEVSSRPLPRHAAFGALQNVVVVPVIGWGRALAVIEVVDAEEAKLAGGRGEDALAYLAQRLAEFLGERETV